MWLTLPEVAQRLRMPVETVRRWVQQGKIPMQLNRGDHGMPQEVLERWAEEHALKIQPPAPGAPKDPGAGGFDGILPAMRRGGIFYELAGNTKDQVLQAAVDRIPNIGPTDTESLLMKLLERERLASTGIGHGIALPHPRVNPLAGPDHPQISTFFLSRPVDFDAIDQRPVSVMLVLLSGATQIHLAMLSRISFYLRSSTFRDLLLGAPAPEALLEAVAALESGQR